MKILWLAPQPPVPPMTGGRERARRMIEYLATRHEVYLVTFGAAEEQPDLDAMLETVRTINRLSYPHWPDWARSGRQRLVNRIVSDLRPDAIHVQTESMWRFIPKDYRGRRVLDCHDVPERLRFDGPGPETIITVSNEDTAAIRTLCPTCPIAILPNGVDVSYWSLVPHGIPVEQILLFPATLNWGPNIEAVRAFCEAMPLLRERVPGVRLVIAGHMPGRDLLRISERDPSISIVPNPPDMRLLFAQAQAIIVPLLHGSGTRLKILQALAAGRPVISTPAGATGLGLEPGRHLLVADMTPPFIDALARLLADANLRRSLAEAGRTVIGRYDWSNFLPILDTVYPP